jgi:hypothetical protein
MHDPWTNRLSAYIDDEMAPAERARLVEHLAACAECTATLGELQAVIAAAAALPDAEPATDLWPAIATRIEAATAEPSSVTAPLADRGVPAAAAATATIAHAAPSMSRRFSFSAPQLAAAAVVLMALSGGFVWLLQRDMAPGYAAGTVVHSALAPSDVRLVDTPVEFAGPDGYGDDVAELERTLDEYRETLDPSTVDVVERSLESIDRAILDARDALAADPGNENLHRQLDNTMRKKVELLRRVTRGAS